MMMKKHTPGPWAVILEKQGTTFRVVENVGANEIATLAGNNNDAANARLIAAAPELLAALEQAAEWLEGSALHLGHIRAAIAKAKGA